MRCPPNNQPQPSTLRSRPLPSSRGPGPSTPPRSFLPPVIWYQRASEGPKTNHNYAAARRRARVRALGVPPAANHPQFGPILPPAAATLSYQPMGLGPCGGCQAICRWRQRCEFLQTCEIIFRGSRLRDNAFPAALWVRPAAAHSVSDLSD